MRMNIFRKGPLYFFAVSILLVACNGEAGNSQATEEESSSRPEKDILILSREQFEASGMKIGDPLPVVFDQTLKTNGMIKAAPGGIARIGVLVPGRVSEIFSMPGNAVKKKERLFYLEGPEIISIQQEYAEAVHKLKLLQANYNRQKGLAEDKIISEKEFLETSSEYYSMTAKTNALESKLKLLNLDPKKIENGALESRISIQAPINGVITDQTLVVGQHLSPGESLMEIVDMHQLQLHLHVYEKDLNQLERGQRVLFQHPGEDDILHEARIIQLGRSIDNESKTVLCIASIAEDARSSLVNNLFVQATIATCERETIAIPDGAILSEEDKHYILVLVEEREDELVFRKTPVNLGVIQKGFAELLEEGKQDILLEGVYNLVTSE